MSEVPGLNATGEAGQVEPQPDPAVELALQDAPAAEIETYEVVDTINTVQVEPESITPEIPESPVDPLVPPEVATQLGEPLSADADARGSLQDRFDVMDVALEKLRVLVQRLPVELQDEANGLVSVIRQQF